MIIFFVGTFALAVGTAIGFVVWGTGKPREVEKVVEKEVEKVVERLVPVGDAVRTVYAVASKQYVRDERAYHSDWSRWVGRKSEYDVGRNSDSPYNPYRFARDPGEEPKRPVAPDWTGRVYLTCAHAFADIGEDADLTPHKAVISGGKAYLLSGMCERDVVAKPKRAKGGRA